MLSLFRRGGKPANNSDADGSNNTPPKKPKSNRGNGSRSDLADNNDDDDETNKKFVNVRYRQWLIDRIHGVRRPREGKYDVPDPYPPSCLCLPPSVIQCCPWLLEENCICNLAGRIGLCSADEAWARNAVMRYSLFLNYIGLSLAIFSCLSIADSNYNLLLYSSLSKAELIPDPVNFYQYPIVLNVGLRGVALDNPNTGVRELVRFDQFCEMVGNGIEKYIQEPVEETCQMCEDVQTEAVIGLIVAVVCFVPAMIANCSRMYLSTDVNCFKVWSALVTGLSLGGVFLAYYQFTYNCLQAVFYEGDVSYARNGEVTEVDSISEVVRVNFGWSVGYGMVCLYSAFGLKVVDFICNCCIPTPSITRNTYDQKIYEVKVQDIADGKDVEDQEADIERDDSFSEGSDVDDSSHRD
jgi:hypothetical protein